MRNANLFAQNRQTNEICCQPLYNERHRFALCGLNLDLTRKSSEYVNTLQMTSRPKDRLAVY